MEFGVFALNGNNGWLISTTSPQHRQAFGRRIAEDTELSAVAKGTLQDRHRPEGRGGHDAPAEDHPNKDPSSSRPVVGLSASNPWPLKVCLSAPMPLYHHPHSGSSARRLYSCCGVGRRSLGLLSRRRPRYPSIRNIPERKDHVRQEHS
jgi:hypothetical protein